MFRRVPFLFNAATGGTVNHRFTTAEYWDKDQQGKFDSSQIADRLAIPSREAQGLMMPDNLTFAHRGRSYPSALGRRSRPGSKACTPTTMFPMYRAPLSIRHGLKKSFRRLTNQ